MFVVAAILAFQIPKARDPRARRQHATTLVAEAELHQPSILLAGSAMAVMRGSVGFLAFFAAFSLKNDLFALGGRAAAAVLGGFVGCSSAPIAAPAAAKR